MPSGTGSLPADSPGREGVALWRNARRTLRGAAHRAGEEGRQAGARSQGQGQGPGADTCRISWGEFPKTRPHIRLDRHTRVPAVYPDLLTVPSSSTVPTCRS